MKALCLWFIVWLAMPLDYIIWNMVFRPIPEIHLEYRSWGDIWREHWHVYHRTLAEF
jgi:hypothetical protein